MNKKQEVLKRRFKMKIILILLLSIPLYGTIEEEYINGMERDVSVVSDLNIIDTQKELINNSTYKWESKIVLAFKYRYSKVSYLTFKTFKKAKDHISNYNFNTDENIDYYKLVITKSKGTYKRTSIIEYTNPIKVLE